MSPNTVFNFSLTAPYLWRWHIDKVFTRINGKLHYLWRAVDHEGEVLEAFVTETRDRGAALQFLKKAMKRYGQPTTIVTDRLRSYRAAMADVNELALVIEPNRFRRLAKTLEPQRTKYIA